MMIRSFINSKSEAFYVVGFSSLDERHRMFTALTESTVFLHNLREHMEFSELLTRLEKRDAGRIDIPGKLHHDPAGCLYAAIRREGEGRCD